MSQFFRPRSLEEALALRVSSDLTVLAGGTDVFPARTARVGWGDMTPLKLLDLSAIQNLRGISQDETGWRIGALTSWSDIATAHLPPLFDGLRQASRLIGGAQVQNRGTIAGNLCTASPAGDSIPVLLSLDASVDLRSARGARTLTLADFITDYRKTALKPDELVIAIHVPNSTARSGFLKLGARDSLVISIAMVSASIAFDASGRIASARIAVGACGPVARRLTALEAALVGATAADIAPIIASSDFSILAPIDDVRASAAYRLDAARVLTGDLVTQLARAIPGGRTDA